MCSPVKSKLNLGNFYCQRPCHGENTHSCLITTLSCPSICLKELHKTTKIPNRVHAGWDVIPYHLYETVNISSLSYPSHCKYQGWRNVILPLAWHPYTILTVNKPTEPFILHIRNVLRNIERESLKAHSRHARSRGSRWGFPNSRLQPNHQSGGTSEGPWTTNIIMQPWWFL